MKELAVLFSLFFFFTPEANAYPIFAQEGYNNPREATGRIVCANCHLAQKPVEIDVPQAVLPNTVFEAVIKIPYDQQIKQLLGNGKRGALNVGAVLILPEGFSLAPPERIDSELQKKVGKAYFQTYSEDRTNILVVGPVPGKKYSEITFPILSPTGADFLTYPIYVGGNRGRGQIYPTGKKSNNNIYTSPTTGTVTKLEELSEGGIQITITGEGGVFTEPVYCEKSDFIIQEGQAVTLDQPLTINPNVGGFGQNETEIVLQNPKRVEGLAVFLYLVLLAQAFLVLKKKQFEKVQLGEMDF